jgi:threonine aldolase
MNFASDNVAGASERVMAALVAANQGALPAYGADEITTRVERRLSEVFEREVAAFMVPTGTAANALALASLTPPWGAILCHEESHVADDECGAPEFFSNGAKLVPLTGTGCRVSPADVAATLVRFVPGAVKHVQPAVLSISQATECGLVYAPDEVRALAETVRARGLALHMDGARFANALVATGASPAEMTWKAGVDILSFGATKNGCLMAEAVIVFDPAGAGELPWRRKRGGHLLSKNRLIAAQLEAYLADGHWLDLARHANDAAAALAGAVLAIPGARLAWPRQANEVFAILPRTVDARLRAAGGRYHEWSHRFLPAGEIVGDGEVLVRLVTSWRTQAADIDAFARAAAG